jgi:hypothetical protein
MTRIWNKRTKNTENMVELDKQYYEFGTKETIIFRIWNKGTMVRLCLEIA